MTPGAENEGTRPVPRIFLFSSSSFTTFDTLLLFLFFSFPLVPSLMTFSENDQDDFYVRRPPTTPVPSSMKPQRGKQPAQQRRPSRNQSSTTKETAFDSANNFSPTVSWPILLAVVPTLGAFFAGSADAWSDFVMILLILYYVYKWLTGKRIDKGTQSLGYLTRRCDAFN